MGTLRRMRLSASTFIPVHGSKVVFVREGSMRANLKGSDRTVGLLGRRDRRGPSRSQAAAASGTSGHRHGGAGTSLPSRRRRPSSSFRAMASFFAPPGSFLANVPVVALPDGRVFADFGRGFEQIVRGCGCGHRLRHQRAAGSGPTDGRAAVGRPAAGRGARSQCHTIRRLPASRSFRNHSMA